MLRRTGMCRQSELVFCKKSQDMGPIFHEKSLTMGLIFKFGKYGVPLAKLQEMGTYFSERKLNMGTYFFGKITPKYTCGF